MNSFSLQIERIDPKHTPWFGKKTVLEHELRYNFAQKFVNKKIVVDLGCGIGYGSFMLAAAGAIKVYGIDTDKNAINHAKNYYHHKNITYIVKDAMYTNLASSMVDIVVAFEIIEHLRAPKKFIQEVVRILKPNGIFILSTPNSEVSFGDNPYHIKEFTFQELKKLLSTFLMPKFFGQRKVNKKIINIYKGFAHQIKIPFIRMFLHFRPWENPKIASISDSHDYLYFVVVCKKSSISSSKLLLNVDS